MKLFKHDYDPAAVKSVDYHWEREGAASIRITLHDGQPIEFDSHDPEAKREIRDAFWEISKHCDL